MYYVLWAIGDFKEVMQVMQVLQVAIILNDCKTARLKDRKTKK